MGGEMRKRFAEGKMKVAYKVNGVVFTHAGLVSTLWSKIQIRSGEDPLDALNAEAVRLLTSSDGRSLYYSDNIIAASSGQNGPMWTRVCYDYWYTRNGRRRRNGDSLPYYMDKDEFQKLQGGSRCGSIAE